MRWMTMFLTLGAAACSDPELLPLLDRDGAMVGSYDPATGSVEVGLDGDAVEVPSGEQADLVDGVAALDEALAPGDAVTVLDANGAPTEALTVGGAETAIDGRYGSCNSAGSF
ncbi:MAG: hypothetical protein ABMA64_17805 [Myxococcota bacterium]